MLSVERVHTHWSPGNILSVPAQQASSLTMELKSFHSVCLAQPTPGTGQCNTDNGDRAVLSPPSAGSTSSVHSRCDCFGWFLPLGCSHFIPPGFPGPCPGWTPLFLWDQHGEQLFLHLKAAQSPAQAPVCRACGTPPAPPGLTC